MKAKALRRAKHSPLQPEIDAIDARKAAMGKPKLLVDVHRELAAKPAARKAAPVDEKKPRSKGSKNDLFTRGRRLKGSGWSGPNQK
jgi:hypothetical protein